MTTEAFSATGTWTRTEATSSTDNDYFYALTFSDGTASSFALKDRILTG